MSDIDIVGHESECWHFTDDDGKPYPALETRGCGCCRRYLKVTAENLDLAKDQARKWLAYLEGLTPAVYPPEIEED